MASPRAATREAKTFEFPGIRSGRTGGVASWWPPCFRTPPDGFEPVDHSAFRPVRGAFAARNICALERGRALPGILPVGRSRGLHFEPIGPGRGLGVPARWQRRLSTDID